MMHARWTAALVALFFMLLAACGGGGTDLTKAQVRLVNASTGYTTLELRVDGEPRQSDVPYGGSASFVENVPGKSNAIYSPGSPTALLTFTPSVSAKKFYSLLAYGSAGALKQLLLDENTGAPDTNHTLLRIVNAAPDAGALDIYVTSATDTLQAAVALQSGLAINTVSSNIDVSSGSWRLRVTAAGSKTDLRLDVSSLTLGSREIRTLVLVPGPGGVLLKALLWTQQSAVAIQPATLARVRVATGLTEVSANVAGTALLAPLNLAAVTAYKAVPAGDQSVVIGSGAATPVTTSFSLTPGADYTLLLMGGAAAPTPSWLSDNNSLPADSTQAKVRLVNGVHGLAAGLSLTLDASPVAVNVNAGAASGYANQAPSNIVQVAVAAAGAGTLFSKADQVFTANTTYSVFLLGPAASTAGVVRADR